MNENGLVTPWKLFQFTDDVTNLISNDQVLGDLGAGRYEITPVIDVADGTMTVLDGRSEILSGIPIQISAAAVTYPELRKSQLYSWVVDYSGAGPNLRINLIDGTTGDGVVLVRKIVKQFRRPILAQKMFLVTADTTGLFSGDQVFSSFGKGYYGITVIAAAAADSTYTVNDGRSDVLSLVSPAVRAAAVTFANPRAIDDHEHVVYYSGEGPTMPVNLVDGSNAEITVLARYYGR